MTEAATAAGTRRYAERLAGATAAGHFRPALGLTLSSIGLGTYLGDESDADDAAYGEALVTALRLGANVVDTAINYRCQRSERVLGQTLLELFRSGVVSRDEVLVATKGGYVPSDGAPPANREEYVRALRATFLDPGVMSPADLVGGVHCMAPGYLRHQIGRSLANLALPSVDLFYLHNPEQQLSEVSRDEFARRLRAAFEVLEEAVAKGRIGVYGAATWNGYRMRPEAPDYLSLQEMVDTAHAVAGDGHHFRAVQLPYNLAMPEALTLANQRVRDGGSESWFPLLEAARHLGVSVFCSASILQGRLAHGLPAELARALPGLRSDAARALQFVRSTPGVTTALVGMKQRAHVEDNLALAAEPPAPDRVLLDLFEKA